ncbi:MAG: sulfite exporter TauE/SafE family protein [Thermoplasmata archaeon]|nr:sulfite exporter TauE/SafE family protein [Thermoplasmata archaeon]
MILALLLLLLLLVAVGAGALGSLVGLGGGIVIVPVLVIYLQVPLPYAVGASAVSVLATSSSSGAAFVKDRLTDLRISNFLQVASVPGALVGAAATVLLASSHLTAALIIVLGLILFATLPQAILHRRDELPTPRTPDETSARMNFSGSYHDARLGREVAYRAGPVRPSLFVMFSAGIISGMFGIGSGVLNVVALERWMGLPMKVATATSNFMIGVTVAAGASVLVVAGYVSPVLAATVALGTTVGAYFGSRLLPRLSNRVVRAIFIPVVAVLAVELILRGLNVL